MCPMLRQTIIFIYLSYDTRPHTFHHNQNRPRPSRWQVYSIRRHAIVRRRRPAHSLSPPTPPTIPLGGPFGGAAGAALATVAGQYAALVFFGWWWLTVPGVAIGDDGDGDDDDHDDDDHGDDAPVPAAGWGANL